MGLRRQVWTLMSKNFRVALFRHATATVFMAFALPIALTGFFSFAQNLFVPPARFGISDAEPILSLGDALDIAGGSGRDRIIFVNNGFSGGDIERVIDLLSDDIRAAGKLAITVDGTDQLPGECPSSLRGVSHCVAAVSFNSSPDEGRGEGGGDAPSGPGWNYTFLTDWALNPVRINVDEQDNDAQVYVLPLQRAVDSAIARVSRAADDDADADADADQLADTEQYMFTTLTQEERQERIRRGYQDAVYNFVAVSFLASVIWITYHLTGFIATERESGMAELVDAMMPVRRRWHAQAVRLLSHHVSFSIMYLPGWVIGSLVLRAGVFRETNALVMVVHHLLIGAALASMSILFASIFKKAQLSGITAILSIVLLGILAQSLTRPSTGPVIVLSLLFAPCNYVYFISSVARYQKEDLATNLVAVPPDSPSQVAPVVFWVFLVAQVAAYPLLGALVESWLHGSGSSGRVVLRGDEAQALGDSAVRLDGFTKVYRPSPLRRLFSFLSKPRGPVVAVDGLSLAAGRGQIVALLGANGSGKSTTLDCVAGTNKLTGGTITIDGTGGLGIAPQKNVLWDDLTVYEHIKIFNRLKSTGAKASRAEIVDLVRAVDLEPKLKAQAKTLSGGQKRKLQLGMMLTGGSAVCCVDEVSSGLDPLSRRKIWDILLAERGRRTLLLTTHFLDEADLLADHIAILSKGSLRAEGSSVQLKDTAGGGYRIAVPSADGGREGDKRLPDVDGVSRRATLDETTYAAPSSALAAQVIKALDSAGLSDYRFSGPTIEDVFLGLAEEIQAAEKEGLTDEKGGVSGSGNGNGGGGLELLDGRRLGYMRQAAVLFRKRFTVFKRNWIPYAAAFLLPIAAAGLVTLYVSDQDPTGCSPEEQATLSRSQESFSLGDDGQKNVSLIFGPTSRNETFEPIARLLAGVPIFYAETLEGFKQLVEENRVNASSGLWLGDADSPPTMAFLGNEIFAVPLSTQNFMNIMLTGADIAASWRTLARPWTPGTGNSLQLLTYMGLALAVYPGFFALYPSVERRRSVRSLEYSNGVRPLPLWLAYLAFDFIIVVVATSISIAIWAGAADLWWNLPYVFVVFLLYGLAATLLSYLVSLVGKSQLSTYAYVTSWQTVVFFAYLISYMCIITYAPVESIDDYILVAHFVVSAVSPIGSALRAVFLTLNLFSAACDGDSLSANPGGILAYGGPILYLVVQSLVLFGLLLWIDGGHVGSSLQRLAFWRRRQPRGREAGADEDEEVAGELTRVTGSGGDGDGLRVVNLTKSFGRNTAVDNVTFGIRRGEVFALLGPNGAGKSTTISLVRGDMRPSKNGGDVLVEDKSVTRDLAAARSHLGVCPQVDAMDIMTVREHLEFYARVRGIPDIEHNVSAVLRAVGLEAFSTRMAHALSGGNKRKLSLGIALMGNPTVVLLDEPSSGLDAAAKRVMWKTLAATVPGRSILLTTHSMEEASALAGRAGILARRMLALGTVDGLRHRFGDVLHVHLVSRTAPRTRPDEMAAVAAWVRRTLPGAELEDKTYHGQMRFSVPAASVLAATAGAARDGAEISRPGESGLSQSAIGRLVVLLEESREALAVSHYSVSPTTLDQVFLTIVGRHNVQEENYGAARPRKWWNPLTWR